MGRRNAVALAAVLLCSCGAQAPAGDDSENLSGAAQIEGRTAFGDPLPGLLAHELGLFNAGKVAFAEEETVADGLGPVFNEASCLACHQGPAPGGSNGRLETRFGRADATGNFDPLASLGGSPWVADVLRNAYALTFIALLLLLPLPSLSSSPSQDSAPMGPRRMAWR